MSMCNRPERRRTPNLSHFPCHAQQCSALALHRLKHVSFLARPNPPNRSRSSFYFLFSILILVGPDRAVSETHTQRTRRHDRESYPNPSLAGRSGFRGRHPWKIDGPPRDFRRIPHATGLTAASLPCVCVLMYFFITSPSRYEAVGFMIAFLFSCLSPLNE